MLNQIPEWFFNNYTDQQEFFWATNILVKLYEGPPIKLKSMTMVNTYTHQLGRE